jgi:hypothetical protein
MKGTLLFVACAFEQHRGLGPAVRGAGRGGGGGGQCQAHLPSSGGSAAGCKPIGVKVQESFVTI